eukprot:CAMPEP_0117672748 /NCGR_PEP_ID=MMETSP0804-20121206/14083_1 /TAXON_ID=1074897 /ORGANISM="Tetraselmis astigmatica, Strain CCMP880" /LENGTH=110 /DNA_ID=CAMNT_0005481397 /DNA_START=89 /DNA_END=421 /DNA_ORIENTATION=-
MKTAVVSTPVVSRAQVRPSAARPGLVVRASAEQSSRRAALGLIAATVATAAGLKADAVEIPSRASILSGMPKSTTAASMSGYTLEGTKKRGITPKRKAEVIAALKKREGV